MIVLVITIMIIHALKHALTHAHTSLITDTLTPIIPYGMNEKGGMSIEEARQNPEAEKGEEAERQVQP